MLEPTRSCFWFVLTVALCGCVTGQTGLSDEPADAAVALFDGKSLEGWEGDPAHWRVEGGALVGEIPAGKRLRHNTWLVWRGGKLQDFDLRLQVKLTGAPAANSGIQFRCQVRDVNHVSGYQADLDQGAVWLGRIYDEHGRALIVERGTRVAIAEDGKRRVEPFAPAESYKVLFRPGEWNDYRIVAIGPHVAVYINGTLFAELLDEQRGEADLSGELAFQLHSGPQTRVEFRRVMLERLKPNDSRIGKFTFRRPPPPDEKSPGVAPRGADGRPLNLGFEAGTLADWTATGDAFRGQPVASDGIARRWRGQTSGKVGKFFVGGYEVVRDAGKGTLTSRWFKATKPFASFLVGGGDSPETRVEVLVRGKPDSESRVLFAAKGHKREQMDRVVVDLRSVQGKELAIRLIDESSGSWGHLNFDDFRFHVEKPRFAATSSSQRSTFNPILRHLRPLPKSTTAKDRLPILDSMSVPDGFSLDLIAAEPRIHQPIAFTFDAKGRLWVAEAHSYPQKRAAGKGLDRIIILEDADGDGRFESRKLFASGLNLVSGLEVGYGGVWIGAAPELLFIPDRNGDDRPDGPAQVLLDGFGFADTHETLNNFLWGPDGWLYGNQGVFNSSRIGKPGAGKDERVYLAAGVWRYHPTRHRVEVFAHGGSNQWGLDYNDVGEFFMTQCRSRWGRGSTTHVVQGGHYWNQANRGFASFISNRATPDRPWMQNYLLASARYGHGEGGAGQPGTRAVFGGHAHVGTMIYLGDNWPQEYRDHLFSHNLHGHQINHQVNVREGSGYWTVHGGEDMFLCADPTYVAVDLRVGPDGAVYMSDWSDQRHCHNPNEELWDRSNGRIYRLQYASTYRPIRVDYDSATDEELAAAQTHGNDWHVRTARRVMAERVAAGKSISAAAVERLRSMALESTEPRVRLRGLWALHAAGRLDEETLVELSADGSEYVRGWVVTLAVECLPAEASESLLRRMLAEERSMWVDRRLASLMPRLSVEFVWRLAEELGHSEASAADRMLPQLVWFGLAPHVENDFERAFRLARRMGAGPLRDYIDWYAARTGDASRSVIVARLARAEGDERRRLLDLLALATDGMRGLALPGSWSEVSEALYDDEDGRIRQAARVVGAAFGDAALYERMRGVLATAEGSLAQKREAIEILAADRSEENIPHFLRMLDRPRLARRVVPLLARYDQPRVAEELLDRLSGWPEPLQATALEVLSSRVGWSNRLLDRIARGEIDGKLLTAYYVRQMASLEDRKLNDRLGREWGMLGKPTSAEKEQAIGELVAKFSDAPLWAFSQQAGQQHFTKLCASCHEPPAPEVAVAPAISGIRTKGVRYIVENVIDPNAVIGKDYRSVIYLMEDGRVITGLPERETETSISIRTATGVVVVQRAEIEASKISENSLMPEALIDPLSDRERIELLKYLMTR